MTPSPSNGDIMYGSPLTRKNSPGTREIMPLENASSQLVEVDQVCEDDADVAVVLRVILRQRLRERLLARHVVRYYVVEEPVGLREQRGGRHRRAQCKHRVCDGLLDQLSPDCK